MTTRRKIGCVVLGSLTLMSFVHQRATTSKASTAVAAKTSVDRSNAASIVSARAVAQTPATRVRPQFGYRETPRGGRQMFIVRPELQFAKTSYADGRTVIVVSADNDRVEITMSRTDGIGITRGAQAVALSHVAITDADLDRARAALAGSTAVRRLRQLTASLEADAGRGPGLTGLRLADAVVGFLDGDFGAVARVAKRFKATPSPAVRRVVAGDFGCWDNYSRDVGSAWEDYESCVYAVGGPGSPFSAACAFEWVIRTEGAWAQFLVCAGFPRIMGD